ncbi:targeted glyoxalase II, putative [Plasmodium chabaudi chabaudi]|uniref:Targeted glyoxalase II, putative n=1 Tax=Plasmodium chabaudi chabaudi TaxID=31271 RepID=A0A1C6Y8I3_PLACU|nr:targeted glyoxalase II, putative [Plasmodium chabaudi chabaudi]
MRIEKKLLSLGYFAYAHIGKPSLTPKLFFENTFINRRNIYNMKMANDYKYYIVDKKDLCAKVIIIPMYNDNYSYIFYDDKDEGIVVDPSDYNNVINISEKENIKIKNVLCTHKHSDHNSGNFYFYNKNINVYGIKERDNKYINKNIEGIQEFEINNFKIKTYLSNFHCKNHVSYIVENSEHASKKDEKKNLFFTGDFLFIAGMGKNFEANNIDMYNSIHNIKKKIDINNTYIFCGHEYTLSNIKFALTVDPNNDKLNEFYQQVLKNENCLPTVPTLLSHEYSYNPFLRYDNENVKKVIDLYAKKNNYVIERNSDYLVLLRIMKDNFKTA